MSKTDGKVIETIGNEEYVHWIIVYIPPVEGDITIETSGEVIPRLLRGVDEACVRHLYTSIITSSGQGNVEGGNTGNRYNESSGTFLEDAPWFLE